jgi:hypothetical protein
MAAAMRKPRSDAKLMNLPEEQRSQLAEWLLQGRPFHVVLGMVKESFHVSTSLGGLSHFYAVECADALIARRRRAVRTADEIAAAAEKDPGRFDKATIEALKQQAFELSIAPSANPKDVKALFSLVLKARDQDFDEKELALARERFEFDAAKSALEHVAALKQIAGNKTLCEQEKLDAVRKRLFGVVA